MVSTKKVQIFMRQIEFCGHILQDGCRVPAPGKLMAIQKWERPSTITALRGFLGLANYYSCYVPLYAQRAAPLMGLLCVGKREGRKGSKKPLSWGPEEIKAFKQLKVALSEGFKVFNLDLDRPFRLRTDASRYACGAVLEQERLGVWVPIAFHSRKLTQSQRNWTPREQETYATLWH